MKKRILVVDDEITICEIISSILTKAGYECRLAGDGVAALALIHSGEQYDLLVSGLMMPNMDGMELLDHVKRISPHVPFVMVTSVHDDSVRRVAFEHGANGYVLKPFRPHEVLAAVATALEKSA